MRYIVAGACAALLLGLFVLSSETLTGGEKEFKTIKDVMKACHVGKPAVCAKFVKGEANDEEKKLLVKAYEFLTTCKSPAGNDDNWKTRTAALLKAVKDGDTKAYKQAINCKTCHDTHKKKA